MKKVLGLITLIIFLSSTFIFAQQKQQPPIWDIRAMAVGNGVVNLTVSGSMYATIPRSDAKIIIDILDSISSYSGIYPERVNLVGQNTFNASAGYINGVSTINIYKPMFDILIKDRDLAAFLLGHEMGHLYFRHGENAKSIQAAGELVALIAGSILSAKTAKKYGNPQLGAEVGNLLGTAVATSFTRDQERESDKIALEWMIKNGFNPEGAIRLFTAFQRMGGNSPIPFFQTHPNPGERIDNVKTLVAAYYAPKNTTVQTTAASKEIKQETTITKAVTPVVISDEITKLNALIDEEKLNQYPKTENGIIATTALAKKDYARAKIYFEKCAVEGGLGVPIDKKKSAELYKQASDKGLSIATTNYASSLSKGDESGFREGSKALSLYIAAAEKGSPKAMGMVAYLSQLKGGWGENQIPTTDTLVNYAKVSAMRGFSEGQMALGSFYRKGFGVSQDFELAETNLLIRQSGNCGSFSFT
jgi:Zn-dependent protease with chaperone function